MKKIIRPIVAFVDRVFGALFFTGTWFPFIRQRQGVEQLYGKSLLGWLNFHQFQVLGNNTTFMGHRALKNPIDAWVYQEIIYEVQPDVILEIGNKHGGSTLYLAGLLEVLGKGRVLALDLNHDLFQVTHPRIDKITGDSMAADTIAQVHDYCRGKTCLIIHDAIHTRAGVLTDLRNYCDLVNSGSYLIVEDTFEGFRGVRGYGSFLLQPQNTPLQAVFDFMKETQDFEVDRAREKWILTSNPFGFLRRK
jgi:cephalosporin hydroxylase